MNPSKYSGLMRCWYFLRIVLCAMGMGMTFNIMLTLGTQWFFCEGHFFSLACLAQLEPMTNFYTIAMPIVTVIGMVVGGMAARKPK